MAKIVSRLINNSNFKFVSKSLFSSGVLHHSNNAASNFSTNIIFTHRKDDPGPGRWLTEVSKLRHRVITDDYDDFEYNLDDNLVCFKYRKRHLKICSHSHGIVCFSNCDDDIFLFNPFTFLFLPLHPPPLLPSHIIHTLEHEHDHHYEKGVGFCYDPDSNHFKVVRFVIFQARGRLQSIMAHVYNSVTGRWTQTLSTPVQAPFPIFSLDDHVFHDGVCYWVTETDDGQFIQSFDMTREVFNPLIPISNLRSKIDRLCIWNGSIVLVSLCGDQGGFDIWGMDKDDESGEVWLSKLLTFRSSPILRHPLLFVNSNELLGNSEFQDLQSYNTKTHELKSLQVQADQVSIFEKSSISVEGGTTLTGESFPFDW